ncbi:MAG: hypothetical protein AAGF74_17385 [Pseudomonadota bacterium]
MAKTPGQKEPQDGERARAARLKAALKANLAKRKAQAKARQADERPEQD